MTVDFTGSDPQVAEAVQLRRRHHDQRLPAPHQVPDHAARPGRRGLLPPAAPWSSASARCWPPSQRRRRATTCRSTCSSIWGCAHSRRPCPTACPPAPTATRCRPSPSRHAPGDRAALHQGDLNAGGTGARPDVRRRVGDDHLRGLDRAEQSSRGRWSRACRRIRGSCATACGRTPAAPARYRGGLGIEREYEFLRRRSSPFSLRARRPRRHGGLAGGQAGAVSGVVRSPPRRLGAPRAQGHPAPDRRRRACAHHDGRRRRARCGDRATGGSPRRRARATSRRARPTARLRDPVAERRLR